jgi:soluble lytic murein transglycosylase
LNRVHRWSLPLIGLFLLVSISAVGAQTVSSLSEADTALANGDYDTAISAYTAALNDQALRCPSLYGLGLAYLRAGQYENAEATFNLHLIDCETSFRGLVLRGEARQNLGRAADALADYQQAISLNPNLLDSYLYERMASLDPDQSVYYLRLAAEADRQPEGKFTLREKLGEVYLLVGSPMSALAEYNTLLAEVDAYLATLSAVEGAEFDRDGNLRARIEYAAADIELQTGQANAGYARLQRIITDYPATDSALPALIRLVNANQPVDLLARMRINVLNENYFPVVDVLTDYLNDPATAAGAPAELYLLLGRAQRGRGDLPGALNTFARLRQQFPDDPAASTAALEQGQLFTQAGDNAGAANAYIDVVTSYPQSPAVPQALLLGAEAAYAAGDREGALALYDQLAVQYPASEQARQGLFEAGLFLRGDDPALAADMLGRANTAEGFLWQGKLLQQMGNTDAARAAWERAQAAEPGTFFALRGCELISGRDSLVPSATFQLRSIEESDRAAAEAWVAQVFNLPGVSAELSPELANNPILQRGLELWAVGLWEEARREFDVLHKLNRDNPAALLQLAFYYQTIPVYRSSVFAATRLIFASDQPILSIPQGLLRLAFPIYYADLLTSLSNEKGLDPLLVAALVRQESSFDPTVVSIADARGLMQLVPATAQDVAAQLSWPDYSLDDLFRPMVSLAFGTHYLSAMRAFQGDSDVGALLSYNAGPGIARTWLNAAGGDLDTLYQAITYDETRSYLEIIYVNHFIYQYLYTDNAPTCGFDQPAPSPVTPSVG